MATPQQTGSQAVERASALLGVDRRVRRAAHASPRWSTSSGSRSPPPRGSCRRWSAAGWCTATAAGAFRPGALFSLHAARPSALHDLSELARPTMEHLSQVSRRDGEPRGAARRPGRADRPGRRPVPDRRHELGRGRRARALHGAGQGALRLRRAPAAAGQPRAPYPALAGRPGPARPRPRRGAPPRAGPPRSTSWSSASPPSAHRCARSTARSSRPCRSPDRPAASTTTASPRSAICSSTRASRPVGPPGPPTP